MKKLTSIIIALVMLLQCLAVGFTAQAREANYIISYSGTTKVDGVELCKRMFSYI